MDFNDIKPGTQIITKNPADNEIEHLICSFLNTTGESKYASFEPVRDSGIITYTIYENNFDNQAELDNIRILSENDAEFDDDAAKGIELMNTFFSRLEEAYNDNEEVENRSLLDEMLKSYENEDKKDIKNNNEKAGELN